MPRGAFQFDVTEAGDLLNTPENVEALRQLWLNRTLVTGRDLGPGNPGDFDVGAWHVACHLAGAGGVRRTRNGALLWLEISHDPALDEYYASVTVERSGAPETLGLDSTEGRALLQGSILLGFVEGSSTGRISARGVNDPPDLFNRWQRQDFDQPIASQGNGGKVWEHWCTLRDIRASHRIGTSVLAAYVSLAGALGDRFAPTVARGRRQYGHPVQLAAMVHAGFTAKASALWNTTPVPIPRAVEPLFLQGEPPQALEAVARLDWSRGPLYYMFKRRIRHWSPARSVRSDLNAFSPEGNS
jgi:hypothetical protein